MYYIAVYFYFQIWIKTPSVFKTDVIELHGMHGLLWMVHVLEPVLKQCLWFSDPEAFTVLHSRFPPSQGMGWEIGGILYLLWFAMGVSGSQNQAALWFYDCRTTHCPEPSMMVCNGMDLKLNMRCDNSRKAIKSSIWKWLYETKYVNFFYTTVPSRTNL